MCGIVGYFSKPDHHLYKHSLSSATRSLTHRGPDDVGLFFDDVNGVGLGHCRLSIIDLSPAGHQPMASDDGKYVIIFNGEIYNFVEIKKILKTLGHHFKSKSDTEVIIKAYQQWGNRCLDHFVGMFVFAIWDQSDKTVFIARDRLGIKPLYYYVDGRSLLFASELKAIMAFSRFPRDVDQDAFQLFLHYQYIPAPRTIFKHTFKLEPGHFLHFNGRDLIKKQWWVLPQRESRAELPIHLSENRALSQLDAVLTQVVSDRLVSDVPLGALLSGGVDSSIVVALMQKINRSPVRTFSIGFKEEGFNEAQWARKVAMHLGTDHTEYYVCSNDALKVIPTLPEMYDEPFADSSAIPTFLVSQLTRSAVTVALSGDGGDEQFAGYTRYWMTGAMARWMKPIPTGFRRLFKHILVNIPVNLIYNYYERFRKGLPERLQVENFPDKWSKVVDLLSETELAELYRLTVCIWPEKDLHRLTGAGVPESTYEFILNNSQSLQPIERLMRTDQCTYLPDAMLTKVDRASMATSLEVRVPLLDHRVLEFTARLPDHFKYRNGKGKYLLRKLLTRYVPHEWVDRPKMGFGIPIGHWLKTELKELLSDYLSPAHLHQEGRLDSTIVSKTLQQHMSGQRNHHHRLWALLMWEMWRERWLCN